MGSWARPVPSRLHGFDDLLRLVCGALRRDEPGTLAAALRASFRAALIDEFQDTDDVQWEIFRRAFRYDGEILETGYPRNDVFHGPDVEERAARVRAPPMKPGADR